MSGELGFRLPGAAFATSLLLDAANHAMGFVIGVILFEMETAQSIILADTLALAVSAPIGQAVAAATVFGKVALAFPGLALAAPLLIDTTNNPVRLLIFHVWSWFFPVSSIVVVAVRTCTLSAPMRQAVREATVLVKLAMGFRLVAFCASLRFFHLSVLVNCVR